MPNHTTNRVRFMGDPTKVKELMKAVSTNESPFDFNNIIPMPETLNCESGSYGDFALLYFHKIDKPSILGFDEDMHKRATDFFSALDPKGEEYLKLKNLADTYKKNIDNYGHKDWYSWRIANWGTKWNAYHFEHFEQQTDEVTFDTAWASPLPIFFTLSEMYKDITISVDYYNEDGGTGNMVFLSGQIILENHLQE